MLTHIRAAVRLARESWNKSGDRRLDDKRSVLLAKAIAEVEAWLVMCQAQSRLSKKALQASVPFQKDC